MADGDGSGGDSNQNKTDDKQHEDKQHEDKQLTCGLVMPISKIDGLSESHWLEVRGILIDSIESGDLGFDVTPVFESDEAGIIQKTIVQNLYDNDIVVCDVSCNNPNVMFELGMRLAFNKPTVIVIDDQTKIVFDTGVIEHIIYPRDLRHTKILKFKELLKKKVENTYLRSKEDDYQSFLDNFTKIEAVGINHKQVSDFDYLKNSMNEMSASIRRLNNRFFNDKSVQRVYSISDLMTEWEKEDAELFKGDRDNFILRRLRDYLENRNFHSSDLDNVGGVLSDFISKSRSKIIRNLTPAEKHFALLEITEYIEDFLSMR